MGLVVGYGIVGGGVGWEVGNQCTKNSSPRVRKVVIPTTTMVGGVIGGGIGAYRYTRKKTYQEWTQHIVNDAIEVYVSLRFEDDPLLSIGGSYTCPLSGEIIQQCARLPKSQTCYEYNQLLELEDGDGVIKDPNRNGQFRKEDIILDGWKDVVIAKRILYLIDKELQDLGENPPSQEKEPRVVMRDYFDQKYKTLWDRERNRLWQKCTMQEFVPGDGTDANDDAFTLAMDEFKDTCGRKEQLFNEEKWNSLIEQEN